jgi:molybdate-binding protein
VQWCHAGIGIEAAARRLKLDFIPLFVEDYYLLGKRETVEGAVRMRWR